MRAVIVLGVCFALVACGKIQESASDDAGEVVSDASSVDGGMVVPADGSMLDGELVEHDGNVNDDNRDSSSGDSSLDAGCTLDGICTVYPAPYVCQQSSYCAAPYLIDLVTCAHSKYDLSDCDMHAGNVAWCCP